MDRRFYLLITVVLTAATLAVSSAPAIADSPEPTDWISATVGRDGSAVDVAAGQSKQHLRAADSAGRLSKSNLKSLTKKDAQALLDQICIGDGTCGTRNTVTLNPLIPEAKPGEPAQPGAPARTVTIADVARFLPARGVLHAEPDGWAVVGVPANYWVDVDPMIADGELLGEAAQVRFIPRAYAFDYGDGTSRTTGTPGASWADLGQDELTATTTSHVYRTRAHLDVSVNVVYSADYRIAGGDWVGVAGAVTASAPDVDTLVVAERTVLTAGDLRP